MLKSVRALDDIFSIFIRKRDADIFGYIICVSCKRKIHWKEANNCHFIDRKHMATRWDEINCNAGCVECNLFKKKFHIEEYTKFLIEKYGPEVPENLKALSRTTVKFTEGELREKIIYYKQQSKQYDKT